VLTLILAAAIWLPPAEPPAPAYRPRSAYERLLVDVLGGGAFGVWGQGLALRELIRLDSPARFGAVPDRDFHPALLRAAEIDRFLRGEGE